MPIFAELSADGYVVVVGAIVVGVLKVIEKIFDRWQLLKAADKVAVKVEEVKAQTATDAQQVKDTLKISNAEKKQHLDKQDKVLDEIKEQTNGMTAKLEAASFIAGVKSETDKPK